MTTVSAVMSITLAVLIFAIGTLKIFRAPSMVANAEHLGYSVRAYQTIGVLEMTSAVGLIIGLFWPPLGVAAAIGLVVLLVGAVWSLRRAGDGMKEIFPALWVGAMSAATAGVTIVAM